MYSDTGDTTSLVPGFPIRTSSDQRSVDSSPRHIAASHVLHRLLMPRHPPCALKHLQHKKTYSTKHASKKSALLLRCSQPLSTNQTPHPTTKMERQPPPRPQQARTTRVLPQDPTVCLMITPSTRERANPCCRAPSRHPLQARRLLTAHTPTN
jgi:hypothetical protein